MYIYIITFAISIITYIFISRGKNKLSVKGKTSTWKLLRVNNCRFGLFCASLAPMMVAALRYEVGTDYRGTYYCGFFRIMDRGNVDGFEIGYYYFVKLIQIFTDNPYSLFVITSIIFVGMTYKSIGELSDDIPFSILLFFLTRYYFVGLNGVRQFISLSILAFSIKYVIEKNFKKFMLFILIASIFHYMSILFVPVYFLGRFKLSLKRIILFSVAVVVFFKLGFSFLLFFLGGTKYGILLTKYNVCGIKFTIFTIALNAILFFISYKNYDVRKNDEKYIVFLNIQFFAFLAALVIHTIPQMERVYWIYSFPIIVTLPYLLSGYTNTKTRQILKWGLITILLIYLLYDIIVLGDHGVLPYNIWIGKPIVHYSGFNWY